MYPASDGVTDPLQLVGTLQAYCPEASEGSHVPPFVAASATPGTGEPLFSLDDSQAMTPAMKLSNFPEIVVGARISKTAAAAPQSGDLEGLSGTVKVGATDVAVVIDKILP